MASDFIDGFGSFDKMCQFLSEEACDSNFTDFYVLVERLTSVCNREVSGLFNTANSFLWFGLFSRFTQLGTGTEDKRFIGFMEEFIKSLHSKKINGESYDDILENNKNTKNKDVVKHKMEHLEKLMYGYLGIVNLDEDRTDNKEIAAADAETFIQDTKTTVTDEKTFILENVGTTQEELDQCMEIYKEALGILTSFTVEPGSKLLDKENRLSLLAMVAYSYKESVNLNGWLVEYAKTHNTYFKDQKKNYIYMKEDFIKYMDRQKRTEREAG